jgi:hypothetical protein
MGIVSLIAIAMAYGASGVGALLWALLIAAIALPVLLSPSLRSDGFHPYSYFAFSGLVGFGIPALLVLKSRSAGTPLGPYTPMLLLLGGAFFLYWSGYASPIARRLARAAPTISFPSRSIDSCVIPALALYILGWIGRVLRGGLGVSHLPITLSGSQEQASGIFGYLSLLGTLGFVTLLAFLLSNRGRKRLFWMLALTLLVVEIAAGAIDGGRTAIMLPILYGAFVFSWCGRRPSFLALVVLYTVAVLLLGPYLTMYRESYYELLQTGKNPSVSTVVDTTKSAYERQGRSAAELRKDVSQARNVNVESTLRVLDRTPDEYPYTYGSELVESAGPLLVPRFVWEDKPTFSPGRRFAVQYWDFDAQNVTSMPIGMPAESYANFGYLGLALFPVLGLVFRVVGDKARAMTNRDLTSIVVMHFVLFVTANMTTTFLALIVGSLRQAAVYLLFLSLLHRRLPRLTRDDGLVARRTNKGPGINDLPVPGGMSR